MLYLMPKTLFFLCPTDCLESIINNVHRHENYFYTSLGNSFLSDLETLEYLKELIKTHNIRKIYFILSNDNQIVSDALGGHFFSEIKGLETFYNEVAIQIENSKASWQTDHNQFSILSHYLNKKIKELQLELDNLFNYPIKISGKIYNRYDHLFNDIYSGFLCQEKHSLN